MQAKAMGGTVEQEHHLTFGPFRLDVAHGRLWQGAQVSALRPRSCAMLRYLVEHSGRLVTKAELREHVWVGTHVTDTVLRVCVQEIRAALGDSAAAPHYLETIERRGYRFLVGEELEGPPLLTAGPIVGRQREAEYLEQWWQHAARGARQLVFISGEAGVGKSTVVDLWLSRLAVDSGIRMARGQCVEHYGEGEPYLPVLEALGQLGRGPHAAEVLTALRRYAPMWLAQLPGLLSEPELERLQRQFQGTARARMLRELAEVLAILTAEIPLVLVLEDLHWSDRSTVEVLAYVAQRREPARLLVLGTYRPVEAVIQAHPLRSMVQELCGRGQGIELCLDLLPAVDVAVYVAGRLGGPVAATLAAFVHERTEGNALFMVNVVDHLVQQGLVVWCEGAWTLRGEAEAKVASLPEGLRQLLMRRIEGLSPEVRRVLEAASVVGEEFSAAAVAAASQFSVQDVQAVCEALAAQRHLIDDSGLAEWPDGTSSGGYRFQHALYQQVLYEQVGTARRVQLHQRIGVQLEVAYSTHASEIATLLAVHFERGGEIGRAIHYWQQVGENAIRRDAHHEATAALTRGLELIAKLPDDPERTQRELVLQLILGELLMAMQGMASPDAGDAYSRAYTLCQQLGDTALRSRVLWGLVVFHSAQGQLRTGARFSQQFFDLAQRQQDPVLMQEGHILMGGVALYRGDVATARTHLEQSLVLSADQPSSTPIFAGRLHPRAISLAWLTRALWLLGYADQAQQRGQEALTLACEVGHTPTLAYAEYFFVMLCQCQRHLAATYRHAEALMGRALEQGFTLRFEQGRILRCWALAMQGMAAEGVAQIQEGIAVHQQVGGPQLGQPYTLSLLAEAHSQAGQPEAGLTTVAEALAPVATTDERWWEAELHRLKGELLLQLPIPDVLQAEGCFQQGLDVARGQQARALELRAALSLSRLWQQQGKRQAARDLLGPIYAWFTEGLDTPDLQEARVLLGTLA